jgi:DNA-3-methyladenine glycosylase
MAIKAAPLILYNFGQKISFYLLKLKPFGLSTKFDLDFYQQGDVVYLARQLVGQRLVTQFGGIRCSGLITETEAYRGWGDKACHAHLNRKTKRTAIMYEAGGLAYVYLCYGIHHLFNIVTNVSGQADAVLIRAIHPQEGIDTMLKRRGKKEYQPKLAAGPGNCSQALGINTSHYGASLTDDRLFVEKTTEKPTVAARKRIGIEYAQEDAHLPWRFIWAGSKYLSKS